MKNSSENNEEKRFIFKKCKEKCIKKLNQYPNCNIIKIICFIIMLIGFVLILNYSQGISYYLLIIFMAVVMWYILKSLWMNILKISNFYLLILIILMTLTGWLSIKGFLIVNLVVTLINHFLSDIKYLYGSIYFKLNKNNKNDNLDYNLVDEKKTKEKISTTKFLVNIFVVILYIYLALFEYFFEPFIIGEKSYTTFECIISRIYLAEIRFGIFLFILILIVGLISLFISYNNFIELIYTKFMNFIRKFVYIKKIKKLKNKRTNKEIKVLMYMDYFLNFNRIYKYKDIRLYKVRNVNSKFKKPNSN